MDETYSIKLPVFEGPFDLLLHLIRENKVDIYDIPIALITRQYLEHIEMMKELNLEIAGDFLVMAATLIHIKSRMLLPVEETADTEESQDPRLELVQRLLEYQAFKDAALGLKEKEDEWQGVFGRHRKSEDGETEGEKELSLFDLNLFDLLGAFKTLIDKAPEEVKAITREALTVREKMTHIIEILENKETVRFEEFFKGDFIKAHMIVTFVALLEILKIGLAKVYQEKEFGTIWVIKPSSESAPAA
ncbi:MAG: segregation/condensation protein A [Thermodesulfovibrionales bacterium]|nr:segregation/condensation protein A [Thermodesulfovibrionales bacterium]